MKLKFILPALLIIGTLSGSAFAASSNVYVVQEYKKVQLKQKLKKAKQVKVIKYVPAKAVKKSVKNTPLVKVKLVTYQPAIKFVKR
ncbi:hypothetical protein [Pseudoalteromonas distincta]|uniref:hypothetical protein n=1 Tax=Pseudoalteromonas distincta TaxID=77608 RepID=UPI0039ECD7E5